jgi:hypothetical protein
MGTIEHDSSHIPGTGADSCPTPDDPSDCNAVNHEQREAKALPDHRERDARKATESGGVKFLPGAAHSPKPNQGTENRETSAKIEQPWANSLLDRANGRSVCQEISSDSVVQRHWS